MVLRNLAVIARIVVLVLAVVSPAVSEDEYPICDRSVPFPIPDRCIIGGYRHWGEIYSSRVVHRSGLVSELPQGRQIADVTFERRSQKRALAEYFEESRTTGFIVLKNGQIVFETYRLGADEHSLLLSQSVAKSYVSALVGFAIGDGLIRSVDDPISDYIPELKGSGYEGVPIKAVLQMSSGVAWSEDDPNSDNNRMADEAQRTHKTPVTEFARGVKGWRKPFETFRYADIDTVTAGWLVSRVTGKTLSDYLSEKLWIPLGMESDAKWLVDGDGPTAMEIASGGLNATIRDYARFGLFLLNDGAWQGKQLLPLGWVQEATRPDRPQVQFGRLDDGYELGYQYFWWCFPGPDHAFTAHGIRGQFLYVNPAEDLVIVVTSAWRNYWDGDLEKQTYAVFAAFAAALRQ